MHKLDLLLSVGNTAYDPAKAMHRMRFVHKKSKRVLVIVYHTKEETMRDCLRQFREKGWL